MPVLFVPWSRVGLAACILPVAIQCRALGERPTEPRGGTTLGSTASAGRAPTDATTTLVEVPPKDATAVKPDAGPPPPALACPSDTELARAWVDHAGVHALRVLCIDASGTPNGPFVTLFPNGMVAERGSFQRAQFEGAWEAFNPQGVRVGAGNFRNGLRHGRWQTWSSDGTVLETSDFVDGTGTETGFYRNGQLASRVSMVSGERHGSAERYTPAGQLYEREWWNKGKRDGKRAAGDAQLLRVEETWRNGTPIGLRKIWRREYLAQQESLDSSGERHGAFTFWRNRRTARTSGSYAHGRRDGLWKWFDTNGNIELVGAYRDGKRDGTWKELYENRTIATSAYAVGKAHGTFAYYDLRGNVRGSFEIKNGTGEMFTYFANKKVATKATMRDGKADGKYQEYSVTGRVLVDGTYRQGKRHGVWRHKHADGTVQWEAQYADDLLTGTLTHYRNGKPAFVAHYAAPPRAGMRHGDYTEYLGEFAVVRGQFIDDAKAGTWQSFFPDGATQSIANYQAGMLHGRYQEFASGNVVVAGTYQRGHRVGTWQWFDGNGAVIRSQRY